MSDLSERFRAFLVDAPHWLDMLVAIPVTNVQRRDTAHPVFHGCIDWHSACHGVWSLLAYQGLTGSEKFASIVDNLLQPEKLALEAADLRRNPQFEMPYGRAWFLRLALEDRLVTGSTRLTFMARDVAESLTNHYREHPPEPFAREYGNASWALINLFDYARAEKNGALESRVKDLARDLARDLDRMPTLNEETAWEDFMAVTHNLAELLLRTDILDAPATLEIFGSRLLALVPVTQPARAHHYATNFSRSWALFALYEQTGEERLLELFLDHMENTLMRPSWWRGSYRDVAHWVPQFGIFALQRCMQGRR